MDIYQSFAVKKFHNISHNSELRDIKNQILYTSIQQFINKIEIDLDVYTRLCD